MYFNFEKIQFFCYIYCFIFVLDCILKFFVYYLFFDGFFFVLVKLFCYYKELFKRYYKNYLCFSILIFSVTIIFYFGEEYMIILKLLANLLSITLCVSFFITSCYIVVSRKPITAVFMALCSYLVLGFFLLFSNHFVLGFFVLAIYAGGLLVLILFSLLLLKMKDERAEKIITKNFPDFGIIPFPFYIIGFVFLRFVTFIKFQVEGPDAVGVGNSSRVAEDLNLQNFSSLYLKERFREGKVPNSFKLSVEEVLTCLEILNKTIKKRRAAYGFKIGRVSETLDAAAINQELLYKIDYQKRFYQSDQFEPLTSLPFFVEHSQNLVEKNKNYFARAFSALQERNKCSDNFLEVLNPINKTTGKINEHRKDLEEYMDLLGAISKEFQTAKQDFEITNNFEKWKMQKKKYDLLSKYAEMSSTILEEYKKGGIVSFYNNLKLQKSLCILLELQQEKTILKLKSIDSQFDAIFDERWLKKKNEDLDVILVLRQAYKEVATFGNKFEDVDAQLRLDDTFYKIVKQIAVLENRKLLPPFDKNRFSYDIYYNFIKQKFPILETYYSAGSKITDEAAINQLRDDILFARKGLAAFDNLLESTFGKNYEKISSDYSALRKQQLDLESELNEIKLVLEASHKRVQSLSNGMKEFTSNFENEWSLVPSILKSIEKSIFLDFYKEVENTEYGDAFLKILSLSAKQDFVRMKIKETEVTLDRKFDPTTDLLAYAFSSGEKYMPEYRVNLSEFSKILYSSPFRSDELYNVFAVGEELDDMVDIFTIRHEREDGARARAAKSSTYTMTDYYNLLTQSKEECFDKLGDFLRVLDAWAVKEGKMCRELLERKNSKAPRNSHEFCFWEVPSLGEDPKGFVYLKDRECVQALLDFYVAILGLKKEYVTMMGSSNNPTLVKLWSDEKTKVCTDAKSLEIFSLQNPFFFDFSKESSLEIVLESLGVVMFEHPFYLLFLIAGFLLLVVSVCSVYQLVRVSKFFKNMSDQIYKQVTRKTFKY